MNSQIRSDQGTGWIKTFRIATIPPGTGLFGNAFGRILSTRIILDRPQSFISGKVVVVIVVLVAIEEKESFVVVVVAAAGRIGGSSFVVE